MDEMIVAGVGFRKAASAAEIVAAVDAALAAHGFGRRQLGRLSTSIAKRGEASMIEAGQSLGLAIVGLEDAELRAQKTLTHSEWSLEAAGVASLSEAAALAAAGEGAKLLGPRLALGPVTCALAEAAP